MVLSTVPENQRLVSAPSNPEDTVSDGGKKPPTLREVSPSWFWRVGAAAALLVVPAAYLVLIGIVAHLSGRKQSLFGDDTLEVLQLASTLWPISFAAVVGPFLRTLALYCAERGSTLGSLEFLLTSQTTVAAVKNLFAFRHIHIWTIGIVVIWSFSLLGGQAAVRSLGLQSRRNVEEIEAMHYFSQVPLRTLCHNEPPGPGEGGTYTACESTFGQPTSSLSRELPAFRRAVNAAFSRPDILLSHSNVSTDYNDTVIEQLGGFAQAARLGKQDIWRNVRVPFMELLPEYDHQSPEAWTKVPLEKYVLYSSFIGVPVRGGTRPEAAGNSKFEPLQYQGLEFGLNTKPNLWLDIVKNNATYSHFNEDLNTTIEAPLQLIVGGECLNGEKRVHMIRVCNIVTSYVDVDVGCKRLSSTDDLNCQADRIRRTLDSKDSTYLTDLSYKPVSSRLPYEMPFTTATYDPFMPGLLERYIRQPLLTFSTDNYNQGDPLPACYSDLSQSLFEARFATALNTFLMASYNSIVLTGADTRIVFGIDQFLNSTHDNDSIDGLTRDSPSIKIPNGCFVPGSGVSSKDRLQATNNIRVQIRDVEPDSDVGRIVLTTDTTYKRLDWNRAYV
ncbi:hypothetical protein FLAG1_04241 [Fusarium langsethiae]|uniref:Uncharacterized protein n=1 Tax=Fusarium langsethiae TaxID=179993 RepID=A0A0N0V7C8_FUSLA|nr:hypothetical protein FLAG1_04241 [Fusarium langsethiae]